MKLERPILLYLILTERCNYHCSFCIRNNIGHKSNEFDYDSLTYVTDVLAKEFPNSILLLTGGEPTIHPKFTEIVNMVLPKFHAVQITSNGSFNATIMNFLRPLLKQNLFLQISIDGTEEFHDALRGKHAFKTSMFNLNELKEVSSHVSISSTVLPKSFETVKKLAVLLNSYRFSHFKISPVVDEPHAINAKYSSEWNSFVDELLLLCNYKVNIKKFFEFELMDEFLNSGDTGKIITNCGIGRTKLYIRPNLDILTCSCTNNILGNLSVNTINDIRKRMLQISNIELHKDSVCYACKYKEICNGGCPGYSQKVFGVPNYGDIRCPFVYEFARKEGFL